MLREGKRTGTTYELSRVPAGTPRRDHDLVGLLPHPNHGSSIGNRDVDPHRRGIVVVGALATGTARGALEAAVRRRLAYRPLWGVIAWCRDAHIMLQLPVEAPLVTSCSQA
jgi:hypothetical protein